MTSPLESPHTVMGRVTMLLEPFRDTGGLTLSELARRTGFPRSSAHRMLLQLVEVGLVRRDGTTYHLGSKLVELGALALAHDRVHQAALPVMYDLRRNTGLVVHLAVLDGDSMLYLEKIGGHPAADQRTRTGERQPAAGTVEGAAALACREDRETRIACGGAPIRCVAVAFDAGGEIAVLSAAGPHNKLPDDPILRVREAADAVAAQLADLPS